MHEKESKGEMSVESGGTRLAQRKDQWGSWGARVMCKEEMNGGGSSERWQAT
jgi:hypothetical protein